ncbi:MAG: Nif3-like dinuclear metal center hexameric protein [Oscillospiraceae bacterium]|jgi:dinuclear metal center YbgI/SA1388 family protein|nr:Nif3-like dinuclear metal center hexameric protein [Oscillospiraceae bacterium]
MIVKEAFDFLNELAPFDSQADFDNSGLLTGSFCKNVTGVLLTLDITAESVLEAHFSGANLIISHHPVIFKPIRKIEPESALELLSKFEISCICAHTNLDFASCGVSAQLCNKLGIKISEPLSYRKGMPLGFVGELQSRLNAREFAGHIKKNLNCTGIRFTNFGGEIKKVAVASGSCGELVFESILKGAQAFVTGEIKHHEILAAGSAGLMIFDVGHYKSEDVIIDYLLEIMQNKFSDIKFAKSKAFSDFVEFF